ncbi:NADP-dependent oxidoreductase [Dactylosporangium sp. NPDC005572]|uniref:NADP-dependent oxidoreductase n=1 Tax=Dactylosporangium sp. NPDC005572 TaxID=3156889 RepID=UPI0033B50EBE
MARAVRFEKFGGPEVLQVVEVARPVPGPRTVLLRVRAAGLNPVESGIRGGFLQRVYRTSFPSGQGRDVAGVVEEAGPGAEGFTAGDEVFGWADEFGTHAELVLVPVRNLARRPAAVPWEVAGALYTAGAAAYAAVRAVAAGPGDTVVVAGAAGGVGTLAVQLAREAGAAVVGLASEPHHAWLREHGVIPVAYGDGVLDRLRAVAGQADAFVDTFGGGYVDLALAFGVRPDRINTLIDFEAAARHGVHAVGSNDASSPAVLEELAGLVAAGRLDVPIERVVGLEEVADAYALLERRHTLGKLVLVP